MQLIPAPFPRIFEKKLSLMGVVLFLVVLLFSSTTFFYWTLQYSWLEQQRIAQLIMVFVGAGCWMAAWRQGEGIFSWGLLLALFLGFFSSLLATYPDWALREWSKYVGSLALLFFLGFYLKVELHQKILIFVLLATTAILVWNYFVFYFIALFFDSKVDAYLLVPGFDNPRFYGQFQIVLIPVLHGICFFYEWRSRFFNFGFIKFILLLQWVVVWALTGRGVIFGLFFSFFLLWVVSGLRYKKLLLQVIKCSIFGLFLYWVLFLLVPMALGFSESEHSALRFSLSKRDVLWAGAWGMIERHPFFGVGPLHFASIWNHVAAHPHQSFLQFASEWGLPATLIFCGLILSFVWHGMQIISKNFKPLDAGLWAALVAALWLSQVDGVFVMPYSEGWLVLIGGLALARWKENFNQEKNKISARSVASIFLVSLSFLVVAKIIFMEVPVLRESHKKFIIKENIGSPPRFWDQGWIPMNFSKTNN